MTHIKKEDRPQIKVFVTKTRKFRAKIKDSKNSIPYEVTIGGDSWLHGKGREHEEAIMNKINTMVSILKAELEAIICDNILIDILTNPTSVKGTGMYIVDAQGRMSDIRKNIG